MRDAAAVFALCESCAAMLVLLFDASPLFNIRAMAVGCLVGVIVAACMAPVLHRLSISSQPNAGIKLLVCGSCIGVASVIGVAVADEWLLGSMLQVSVQAWVSALLPLGASLFIIAGAIAARVFGKVACAQTA
jgi:hypothetical protein